MKNQKITVSVGIPAFNEESNIAYLLGSLLAQNQKTYKLKEIVVVSDGSTDQTNQLVTSVQDARIRLIWNKKRMGLNATENRILDFASSDILVIVNADVLIAGKDYIDKIISPFLGSQRVGLVGGGYLALRMSRGWGRVFGNSLEFRRFIYAKLLKPNNIYLCHGSARAFSKAFYKKLRWPNDVPEDAFSYLSAKSCGFRFVYNSRACVYVHPSTKMSDHARQSTRFIRGIAQLKKYFPTNVIDREYHIPFGAILRAILVYLWRRPISTPLYFAAVFAIRATHLMHDSDHSKFLISKSTKKWNHDTLVYNRIRIKNHIFEKNL